MCCLSCPFSQVSPPPVSISHAFRGFPQQVPRVTSFQPVLPHRHAVHINGRHRRTKYYSGLSGKASPHSITRSIFGSKIFRPLFSLSTHLLTCLQPSSQTPSLSLSTRSPLTIYMPLHAAAAVVTPAWATAVSSTARHPAHNRRRPLRPPSPSSPCSPGGITCATPTKTQRNSYPSMGLPTYEFRTLWRYCSWGKSTGSPLPY